MVITPMKRQLFFWIQQSLISLFLALICFGCHFFNPPLSVFDVAPEQSIFDACVVRFRPIMMTTLATIAGAVPIALAFGGGADARRPLGIVIIGGMVFSQLVTLFLTPVIYLYLEQWNEKLSPKHLE
ncbi:hypothetical protein DB43_AP00060 [Parachlamydia acanthamoebae]|nr:hypothetical protein DB43_AP00060 [Parachlamydia acanthamoebae]